MKKVKPMFDVTIRKMDVSDIRFVDSVERQVFGKSLSEQTLSNELLYNKLAHYYMALIDHQRVGYIGVWITEPNAEITNILVLEEHRQKGIGTALLDTVFELCKAMSVNDLSLEVRVFNEGAIGFYQKHGFKIITRRKKYYDNGDDAFLMVKHIGGDVK